MNLHTFIKGPIYHLTRFYLTEVIFFTECQARNSRHPQSSGTCIVHVVVFVNTSVNACARVRTRNPPRRSSYQLHQFLSGESWNAPGNDLFAMRIWGLSTVTGHFFLHPPHTLLQSWDQFHSSADSPGLLKLLHWKKKNTSVFSAGPSLQVICSQGLWVCRSVARHLIKPMAGYSEAVGD